MRIVMTTLACLLLPLLGTAAENAALPMRFPLWDQSKLLPKAANVQKLSGIEFHVVKRFEPAKDGYRWLHGVALAWHKGKLYTSFGHNKGAENTASEEAHGRVSADGGKTWSDVFIIDRGTEDPNLAISHGVFLSDGQTLWAFQGAFFGKMERIHTRAYTLDESTGEWIPRGVVIKEDFWPMNAPVKMDNGCWIMPGIQAGVYGVKRMAPPAVAISCGDDLTQWDVVEIPCIADGTVWGESSIIVDGPFVMNIARYGGEARALAATSHDFGRTWSASIVSNLPMATSKPTAGVLNNGQRYLICTTTADSKGRRSPLTIAVSRPGENQFSAVFKIRGAVLPEGPGESGSGVRLSYPYAVEHEGNLYVGYSNTGGRHGNNNSAEMAIIPIERLRVE